MSGDKEDTTEQPPLPDLNAIRNRRIENGRQYISDPKELAGKGDIEVFECAAPEQITQEIVLKFLQAKRYNAEKAVGRLLDSDNARAVEVYNDWNQLDDAVKGAEGKGGVSKTIDWLKHEANINRSCIRNNLKKIDSNGPFSQNFLREIERLKESTLIFDRWANNCEAAARLFENAPKVAVIEE